MCRRRGRAEQDRQRGGHCRATSELHPEREPPRRTGTRRVATGLASQIELLRHVDGSPLVAGRPAWAGWERGAWPRPHDPIFDFSTPVRGFEWVDQTADRAARVLNSASALPPVVGHSDGGWAERVRSRRRFVAG